MQCMLRHKVDEGRHACLAEPQHLVLLHDHVCTRCGFRTQAVQVVVVQQHAPVCGDIEQPRAVVRCAAWIVLSA